MDLTVKLGNKANLLYTYPKYNDGNPRDTNVMNKAMTWSGIEMKTMTDHSSSKLAELLLQG